MEGWTSDACQTRDCQSRQQHRRVDCRCCKFVTEPCQGTMSSIMVHDTQPQAMSFLQRTMEYDPTKRLSVEAGDHGGASEESEPELHCFTSSESQVLPANSRHSRPPPRNTLTVQNDKPICSISSPQFNLGCMELTVPTKRFRIRSRGPLHSAQPLRCYDRFDVSRHLFFPQMSKSSLECLSWV